MTLSPLQRRRRITYPVTERTDLLAVSAFREHHRRQIAAGELILTTMHATVVDIIQRDGSYFLRDNHNQERRVHPSLKMDVKRPAVPVPLAPVYDPTVIPPESDYTSLSLPMRRALDYFAWADWKPKPHPNTIRALEKRNIISAVSFGSGYRPTPYGSALYRAYGRHDMEVKNGLA